MSAADLRDELNRSIWIDTATGLTELETPARGYTGDNSEDSCDTAQAFHANGMLRGLDRAIASFIDNARGISGTDRSSNTAGFKIGKGLNGSFKSLSPLVGQVMPLRRRMREWHTACPFHEDTQKVFYLCHGGIIYHCFACGAHGDILRLFPFLADIGAPKPQTMVEWDAHGEVKDRRFKANLAFFANLAGMELPLEEKFKCAGLAQNPLTWFTPQPDAGWLTGRAAAARPLARELATTLASLSGTMRRNRTYRLVVTDQDRETATELLCRREAADLLTGHRRDKTYVSLTARDWRPYRPLGAAYAQLNVKFSDRGLTVTNVEGPQGELAAMVTATVTELEKVAASGSHMRLRESRAYPRHAITRRRVARSPYPAAHVA